MSAHLISILGMPLRHYADIYIEYIKNVKARSPNTINAYLQDLNCLARFLELDDVHFSELDNECIISYLKFLRGKLHLKPATVRRRVLTIQAFCQWLVNRECMTANPFDDLELDLKVPKRLPIPVDPLTIRQLVMLSHPVCDDLSIDRSGWTACTRSSQRQTTLLILQLILTTGIRVGEVSSIRIRDISSDGSTIHIVGKGNKERLVYIENSSISNTLSQYRHERATKADDDDKLFVNTRGNTLTPQALGKRVKTMWLDSTKYYQ